MNSTSPVSVGLVLLDGPDATVQVGGRVELVIGAVAEDGKSIEGARIAIELDGTVLATSGLVAFAGDEVATAPPGATFATVEFPAPETPGTYRITATFPEQDVGARTLGAAELDATLSVVPASVHLTVWGLPQPVIAHSEITLCVGAKSSVGAVLHRASVVMEDCEGRELSAGKLGQHPRQGTEALYWCTLPLKVPAAGKHDFRLRFVPDDVALPHAPASLPLCLTVAAPPTRTIEVVLLDQVTQEPIRGAGVRAGAYRAMTNDDGRARLAFGAEQSKLTVWKAGYEPISEEIRQTEDGVMLLSAVPVPEEDPLERWRI